MPSIRFLFKQEQLTGKEDDKNQGNDTRNKIFCPVENLISFNYSLNFFHRYHVMGVSVVSKGQDRLARNIRQNISEM